jgi:hypothetical protein
LKSIRRYDTTGGRIGSVAGSDIQKPFGICGFHFRLTSLQALLYRSPLKPRLHSFIERFSSGSL